MPIPLCPRSTPELLKSPELVAASYSLASVQSVPLLSVGIYVSQSNWFLSSPEFLVPYLICDHFSFLSESNFWRFSEWRSSDYQTDFVICCLKCFIPSSWTVTELDLHCHLMACPRRTFLVLCLYLLTFNGAANLHSRSFVSASYGLLIHLFRYWPSVQKQWDCWLLYTIAPGFGQNCLIHNPLYTDMLIAHINSWI